MFDVVTRIFIETEEGERKKVSAVDLGKEDNFFYVKCYMDDGTSCTFDNISREQMKKILAVLIEK